MLRRNTPALDLTRRVVVLADDRIVSGATITAAIRVLRARRASRIILAVPVAPTAVLTQLDRAVDQVICPRALRWRQNLHNECRNFPDIGTTDVATILHDHTNRTSEDAVPAPS